MRCGRGSPLLWQPQPNYLYSALVAGGGLLWGQGPSPIISIQHRWLLVQSFGINAPIQQPVFSSGGMRCYAVPSRPQANLWLAATSGARQTPGRQGCTHLLLVCTLLCTAFKPTQTVRHIVYISSGSLSPHAWTLHLGLTLHAFIVCSISLTL